MGRGLKRGIKAAIFIVMLLAVSMDSRAYPGQDKDYILTDVKPENRGREHYLEFVSKETYTVKKGDTLWDIAKDYWGNGMTFWQICRRFTICICPEYGEKKI